MTEAYPLRWPDGWPRTPQDERNDGARFKSGDPYRADPTSTTGKRYVGRSDVTFDSARKRLLEELARLDHANFGNVVISTNLPIRKDGGVYSDVARRKIDDPGVAVYFTLKGRKMVMAQDAFETVAANVASLRLSIEAMRTLHRHGGGAMMERAFTGFAAIEPPGGAWRATLGFAAFKDEAITAALIDQHYRDRARKAHPDVGGTEAAMSRLNSARDAAQAWLAAR